MASTPSDDIEFDALTAESRPFREWLTMFPLMLAVIDPYTYESSWILETVARLFRSYQAADCRLAFLATADADGTRNFLGPLTDEFLAFADPERKAVKSMQLETLPAIVLLRQDGTVGGAAEGWNPESWRPVFEELSDIASWSRPILPGPGDPVAFAGTPAS